MPYITKSDRESLAKGLPPQNAGHLNYKITMFINEYLSLHPYSYQTLNDIIGALEGAKMEFYRRMVSPYEEIKRDQNGDVYYV